MSVEAMAWALDADCTSNLKITMIGLANHAHADGSQRIYSLWTRWPATPA